MYSYEFHIKDIIQTGMIFVNSHLILLLFITSSLLCIYIIYKTHRYCHIVWILSSLAVLALAISFMSGLYIW